MENTIERIVLMGSEDVISAEDMSLMLPALKNEKLMAEYRTSSNRDNMTKTSIPTSSDSSESDEHTINLEFIDVGYMAENIEITDFNDKTKEIKRSNPDQSMTLFVSFPDFSENFIDEVKEVDEFIHDIQVAINCYFVLESNMFLITGVGCHG